MKHIISAILIFTMLIGLIGCQTKYPDPRPSEPVNSTVKPSEDNSENTTRRRDFTSMLFDDNYDLEQEGTTVNLLKDGYTERLVGDWDWPEDFERVTDQRVAALGLDDKYIWTDAICNVVTTADGSCYGGINFNIPDESYVCSDNLIGYSVEEEAGTAALYFWRPDHLTFPVDDKYQYASVSDSEISSRAVLEFLSELHPDGIAAVELNCENRAFEDNSADGIPYPIMEVAGTFSTLNTTTGFCGYVLKTDIFPVVIVGVAQRMSDDMREAIYSLAYDISKSLLVSKTRFPEDISINRGRFVYQDKNGTGVFSAQLPPLGYYLGNGSFGTLDGYSGNRASKWGVSWLGKALADSSGSKDEITLAALKTLFGDDYDNESRVDRGDTHVIGYTSDAIGNDMVRIKGTLRWVGDSESASRDISFFVYATRLDKIAPSIVWCIDLSETQTGITFMSGMLMPVAETVNEIK